MALEQGGEGSSAGRAAARVTVARPRATAAKDPICGSDMMSSRLRDGTCARRPSAVSASPSRCRAPVSAESAATASAAESNGGKERPATRQVSPTSVPSAAPTIGKYVIVTADGSAPDLPSGVRNETAARSSDRGFM